MKSTIFCWVGAVAAGALHWWLAMAALLWLGVALSHGSPIRKPGAA